MIKNNDLKTSPKQRIVITIIAIFMLGSTFALYAGIVLNASNPTTSGSTVTLEEEDRYNELMEEYQAKVDKQAQELSAKYFDKFVKYKNRVKSFNQADISEVKKVDLKEGTGKKVTDSEFTEYSAYYVGWLKDGTVFDSSFDDFKNPSALKTPLAGNANMIEGWKQGIVGMKIGGVREISIPSALAYGDQDNGNIPANSSLKFIVMLIDPVEEVEVSEELEKLWYKINYGTEM